MIDNSDLGAAALMSIIAVFALFALIFFVVNLVKKARADRAWARQLARERNAARFLYSVPGESFKREVFTGRRAPAAMSNGAGSESTPSPAPSPDPVLDPVTTYLYASALTEAGSVSKYHQPTVSDYSDSVPSSSDYGSSDSSSSYDSGSSDGGSFDSGGGFD